MNEKVLTSEERRILTAYIGLEAADRPITIRISRAAVRALLASERAYMRMLAETLPFCSQCGESINESACGPTHAMRFGEWKTAVETLREGGAE